jgi:flavin reductase (DIM6/NTAB) family NADH-FMN oxidoreductase RutF
MGVDEVDLAGFPRQVVIDSSSITSHSDFSGGPAGTGTPTQEDSMGQELFGDVLRKFPLVVSVVTVGRGGAENGLTVSWVSPVSFSPPQLMFAVDRLHYSVDFLRSTKNFAVNVLRSGQERLAGHFAKQSMAREEKLDGLATRSGETGAAILTDALAYFDCEVASIHEAGDHLMVVGRVVDVGILNDGEPLMTTGGLRYAKTGPR